MFDPEERQRYIRQFDLSGFGESGQQDLKKAKILIVGLGGLGIPVAQILNGMGAGELGLLDGDRVEVHNLHRQSLYREEDIGRSKAEALKDLLQERNSFTKLHTFSDYINADTALDLIAYYDVVVDCTDNFGTRYLLNDACLIKNKPLVQAALQGFQGQLSVFNYQEGPTYRCLFPKPPRADEIPSCDQNGILGAMPFLVGSAQALEVVKVVCRLPGILSGSLLLIDVLTHRQQKIRFKLKPENREIKELEDLYEVPCAFDIEVIRSWATFFEEQEKKSSELIDVRESTELKGEIASAHLPLSQLEKEAPSYPWKSGTDYYLFCRSGKRSLEAQKYLQNNHPKCRFYSIMGGVEALPA
ncbi:HesA/MoeB/ThiF family protein [Aureicoccus marinus]|uniref:Rhodanese domain-containing protein n=1 Tax=Aureicoccus marinus TaxID=754435 RepID=A0A2S7T6D7_9FLAO|nr:HesA/MoeB/ThiF family protein [Aureicoccus marinus]PQJ15016.1 hypothetical protein BST99_04055 [Aureicoccus marinus]